ncbi:alpha/beta hydrolase [Tenacibaculum amylolyticum]|uniref:alpha/beta hydrolase n=1 Tax=Tenacibaculum amylolyticum TaxID=104269 RepID=UPI00389509C3
MSCNKKILLSIVTTIVLSMIIAAFSLEYYVQSNKYDDVVLATINSKKMHEERTVIIHLPENYEQNKNKTYPVMYVLDGTSQDGHTFAKIDLLSKINEFPEAIVVGIPNTSGNRSRDFTPHYMKIDLEDEDSKKGNAHNFLAFIEKELVPYINSNYRTNGFQTISGHSRGGLFVLYAFIEKPELFNGYISYSPAFWREDIFIAEKTKAFLNENKVKDKFIFMSIGDGENEKMKNGYNVIHNLLNKELHSSLNSNNIALYSQTTTNANHGSNPYKSTIYALDKLNDYINNKY